MSRKSPEVKICSHCKKSKSKSDFYMNNTKSDHLSNMCIECQLKINKQTK